MIEPTTSLVGKKVGAVGLGLMRMNWNPNPPPAELSCRTLAASLASGATFWDSGEFYGSHESNSCHLLGSYFASNPEDANKVVLSIKGGMIPGTLTPDCSEKNVRRSVDHCLDILGGTKTIDIFQCARQDAYTPIEETMQSLAKLVREGKMAGIGLSEVSANTIERAHAIHPIAAVEVEFSLWCTDILYNGVAATCEKLNIPIIAYSPLSQGATAGDGIQENRDIPDGDFRKTLPKFQDDVLLLNNRIFNEVEELAKGKGVTRAQMALSWVLACSERTIQLSDDTKIRVGTIMPIPGATRPEQVYENTTLPDLSMDEFERIMQILRKYPVRGKRYKEESSALWKS